MENNNKELSMEEMGKVSGGVLRTVNTGIPDKDAAMRKEARKGSKQIDHIPNDTVVDTIDDEITYDPVSKRNFVKVSYNGKIGYIAASFVGLPR